MKHNGLVSQFWEFAAFCLSSLLRGSSICRIVNALDHDRTLLSWRDNWQNIRRGKTEKKRDDGRNERTWALSNLRRASRSVVHGGRASFLLHKDGFPLLPAARRLGQVSLRRLLSSRRLGQLPLLSIVIGCGRQEQCTQNLSHSSEAIIHPAASQAWIWVRSIAVVEGSDVFNYRDSLYLVLVWREQFLGHFSVTRTGLKRFGQHCSFTHTLRQKSGIWSARRTIRMVER